MTGVTYHVGKLLSTDHRIVVVMPQNPHDKEKSLVVNTDAIHPRLHDALMDVVQKDGSVSPVLATILQRRVFTDTGLDLLTTLHQSRALQSEPIDNVILYPYPNMPIPLRQALSGQVQSQVMENTNIRPPLEAPEEINKAVIDTDLSTFNPHENNLNANRHEANLAIASNIITEAKMLEDEASRKREQAYKLMPSLRPTVQIPSTQQTILAAPVEQFVQPVIATTRKKPGPKPGAAKKKA